MSLIEAQVVGAVQVSQFLGITVPAAVRGRVSDAVRVAGYMIQRRAVTVELSGGVLNHRSGRLQASVNTRFTATNNTFVSTVGSALFYGRIWELFGIRARIILPVSKKALAWPGGLHPVKRVSIPAQSKRPWLKPALEAMRPTITRSITAAVQGI